VCLDQYSVLVHSQYLVLCGDARCHKRVTRRVYSVDGELAPLVTPQD